MFMVFQVFEFIDFGDYSIDPCFNVDVQVERYGGGDYDEDEWETLEADIIGWDKEDYSEIDIKVVDLYLDLNRDRIISKALKHAAEELQKIRECAELNKYGL